MLKKKNSIKTKKQKLIDRINKCKTLKEIEGWEKTFSYHDILKDDFDWDYEFLLDLIEFKLKRMSQYFHSHHVVKNEDWYGTLCDRAIAILNAGYKTDVIKSSDLKGIYVNTRNKDRFIPAYMKKFSQKYFDKYGLAIIRENKANYLFWKFLHHYIEYLWE